LQNKYAICKILNTEFLFRNFFPSDHAGKQQIHSLEKQGINLRIRLHSLVDASTMNPVPNILPLSNVSLEGLIREDEITQSTARLETFLNKEDSFPEIYQLVGIAGASGGYLSQEYSSSPSSIERPTFQSKKLLILPEALLEQYNSIQH
jgi:hypothetical protein